MAALTGKVALVTGSSRGIGTSIAKLFAEHGAEVVLHGRDEAALLEVTNDINLAGGRAVGVTGDVTKFVDIEVMRKQIEHKFGPVDILVANAGGSFTPPGMPLEEISEAGWQASLDGNVTATFLTLKSFLPSMKQRKSGAIITISSTAGRIPHTMAPIPYGVAKAGIRLLTQNLAAQVGPFGIRVNCIAPETILTERNQQRIPEAQKAAMAHSHPMQRLGTPIDVAHAALFLVTDKASWITGVTLDVAGGAVML